MPWLPKPQVEEDVDEYYTTGGAHMESTVCATREMKVQTYETRRLCQYAAEFDSMRRVC